ncbi:MAG: hypothetical protein JWQ73_3086 [Variovorax sp.]|jgi:hypothetical protein|nr:hypothetical protein [Variovorax sp.]
MLLVGGYGGTMKEDEKEREIFALVLLKMVRDKCGEQRTGSVSRTSLQALVPVNERSYVRRGLTALVDHGALVMSGEQIGMTSKGHLFIVQRAVDGTPLPVPDPAQNFNLIHLRRAICQDARLSHQSLEAAQTLPGRLEERDMRLPLPRSRAWLVFLALAIAAAAVYWMTRTLEQRHVPMGVDQVGKSHLAVDSNAQDPSLEPR